MTLRARKLIAKKFTPELRLRPDACCKYCRGEGMVTDRVPWGVGTVSMHSWCECVTRGLSEEETLRFERGEFTVLPARGGRSRARRAAKEIIP